MPLSAFEKSLFCPCFFSSLFAGSVTWPSSVTVFRFFLVSGVYGRARTNRSCPPAQFSFRVRNPSPWSLPTARWRIPQWLGQPSLKVHFRSYVCVWAAELRVCDRYSNSTSIWPTVAKSSKFRDLLAKPSKWVSHSALLFPAPFGPL